jgi:hypothetical protein
MGGFRWRGYGPNPEEYTFLLVVVNTRRIHRETIRAFWRVLGAPGPRC